MESSGNEIIDQILTDANEEAENIVKDAQTSAETIIQQQRQSARHNTEKKVQSLLKRAENDADIIRGKVSTDIKMKADWIVLSEKNRLITNVVDEIKNRLMKLKKSEKYVPVLEKLIVDAGTVLGGGMLELLLSEKDSTLVKLNTLEK